VELVVPVFGKSQVKRKEKREREKTQPQGFKPGQPVQFVVRKPLRPRAFRPVKGGKGKGKKEKGERGRQTNVPKNRELVVSLLAEKVSLFPFCCGCGKKKEGKREGGGGKKIAAASRSGAGVQDSG